MRSVAFTRERVRADEGARLRWGHRVAGTVPRRAVSSQPSDRRTDLYAYVHDQILRGFLTSPLGAARCPIGRRLLDRRRLSRGPRACAAVPARGRRIRTPLRGRGPGRHPLAASSPLTRERVLGTAPEQGLYRPNGEHFWPAGVVWGRPDGELHGRVQVRTRSAKTRKWSGRQDVETHNADHGADPGYGGTGRAAGARGDRPPVGGRLGRCGRTGARRQRGHAGRSFGWPGRARRPCGRTGAAAALRSATGTGGPR